MAIRKFRLLSDGRMGDETKAGTTVYELMRCDYGLSNDDDRMTGIEHISVTLSPEGDYPSFTHPKHLLEEIKE